MLSPSKPLRRSIARLLFLILPVLVLAVPAPAVAQEGAGTLSETAAAGVPSYWYLLAVGLSLLVPAGLTLIAVAELEAQQAWYAALGALATLGLVGVAYWAVGFALQFGGVGLVYTEPGLRDLVWEWSPLSADWGIGWGMAGLSGWFLAGGQVTSLAYALFLAHLPWAVSAALIPIVALRGRAPALVTFFLALFIGGILYPLAGNWVQGGGWLNALGRNLNLGHGFVDFGGAGSVHLAAASFAVAALLVWVVRRENQPRAAAVLPPAQLPLLAVLGSLLMLGGSIGWLWANPLQMATLSETALMRGSVNIVLAGGAGALVPLLYTWFVSSRGHPVMSARGLAAGIVAGLACGPFVQPGPAFLIGLLAGATVPFVAFLTTNLLHLKDFTGAVETSAIPAVVGLLLVAVFADGVVGRGWQVTGVESYLGVSGQGVSGLLVARGFQADFPGQLQAQMIGVLALALWGFLAGTAVCIPLGLLTHGLSSGEETSRPGNEGPPPSSLPAVPPVRERIES